MHRPATPCQSQCYPLDASTCIPAPRGRFWGDEIYTAVFLPATVDGDELVLTLTVPDLLGELAEEEGIAVGQKVVFHFKKLRRVVG